MSQQAKTRDVGASMDAARFALLQFEELRQGCVLAGLHPNKGLVQIVGSASTLHGSCKENSCADRAA